MRSFVKLATENPDWLDGTKISGYTKSDKYGVRHEARETNSGFQCYIKVENFRVSVFMKGENFRVLT